MTASKIRALVVDDSAYNRRAIVEMLQSADDVAVVGMASDGEEGLRLALALRPDVITLDLEMPNIDGFTFLRLLMAQCSIPVIVISGYTRSGDVFKALELGAIDFIAKPARHFSREADSVREQLLAKVSAVRLLRRGALAAVPGARPSPQRAGGEPKVVLIGASTGGPRALLQLLSALPGELSLSMGIAQHMPERFTRAFAQRLDRVSAFEVSEARTGDAFQPGRVLVAPGGQHLRMVRSADGVLRAALSDAQAKEKYVPSIDDLFKSAALAAPERSVGILLTGMGSDGREGMLALKRAGALTIAESEETAVIFGMPREAIAAGAAGQVLGLAQIVEALGQLGRSPADESG